MKILMVSWSILPRAGGSSVIVENLAQNFQGSELVVLGGSSILGAKPLERQAGGPKFVYFSSEIDLGGRGARFFKSIRQWRFQPLVEKIKALIVEEKIDYVIGVYPDDLFCLAACRAAQQQQVPFSSYFHNTYVENTNISNPKAVEIQKQIFDHSEQIFVMSKGMQAFYEEKYQGHRFIPLVHTFNEYPDLSRLSGVPGEGKSRYELVAIGNFNESNLEATRRLVKTIADREKYGLNLYTHVPKLLLQKRGLNTSAIEHQGFLQPDQVHGALQKYDIAVLTHGFTGGYGEIEYRTIFPTRTIPLLLSGKPILAHSPPGSFLNDFIRENACAELIETPSEDAVLEGLERIANDEAYQKQLVAAARKTAEQFYGPNVVKLLQNTLSETQV